MRLLTGHRLLSLVLFFFPCVTMAQLSQSNPDQYVIIHQGQKKINDEISKQTKGMQKTAALQGSIAYQFNKIKNWEGKYNSYLKTAQGYAEQLKAGTSIYADGVETLRHLYEIQRAISHNPTGIGATIAMNNLYMETASEFVKVFRLLKESVAKGGETNMLNTSQRTEMLWQLADQLENLNSKLRMLAISIAYHNMTDVWNKYTAGMVERDRARIASEALDRWKRSSEVASVLNP